MKKFKIVYFVFIVLFNSCDLPEKQKDKQDFKRIVVLGQAPLETLLKLGYKDQIVGIAYLDQPEVLKEFTDLPIMTISWPDKESVLSLKPDLIFALESAFRSNKIGDVQFWEKRGVKTCVVDNYKVDKNLKNLREDLAKTGKLFEIESKTDTLIQRSIAISQKYKQLKKGAPKRVLHLSYTGSADKYYYYPPTMSLIDEVITECGGEYINLGPNYFIIPLETIIQSNPDKIVITWFRKQDQVNVIEKLCAIPILQHLQAIKKRQIIEVDYTQAIRGTYEMESIYLSISNFLTL